MYKKYLQNHSLIAVLLAAFVGGGIPVFAKIGLKEIPPFSFTLLRFFIAFILILPLFLKQQKSFLKKDVLQIILLSLLGTANVTLFAFGVRLTTATIGQVLYASVPIIAIILSYLLLGERFKLRKILGVIIGLLGVLIILILPLIGKPSVFKGNIYGNILIFIAILSFTTYTVLSKKFLAKYSAIYLTTFYFITTVIVELLLSSSEVATVWWRSLSIISLIAVLYVGIMGGFAYYLLYQYAIKKGSPVIASLTLYVQPVMTYGWAVVLLGEQITQGFILGALLIFLGTYLASR